MIEFGKTLRQAREAKGLSIAQIADSTHLMSQIVEGLENEDFSRIVAPIYGRGFVRLYCEAVGLDPKELIAEFMEIYNGNRVATIRLREVQPTEPEAPKPVEKVEAPEAAAAQTEPVIVEPHAVEEEPPTPTGKRSFKMPEMSIPEVPPSLWRMATLVVVAIVVIWVAFIGFRALYRATMTAPAAETSAPVEAVQPEKKAKTPQSGKGPTSADKKVTRNPMPIPPLYVD